MEGVLSRFTKVKCLTVRNRTFEQKVNSQIMTVVKKAKETLTSLTFSPEIALGNNAIAKLGTMTNLTSLKLAGNWIKTTGIRAW